VYVAAGALHAVPFDVDSLEVRGKPVPVLDGLVTKANGAADFAISSDGTLVYRTGAVFGTGGRTLVWVDRQGREEPIPMPSRAYALLSLSPDGSQVALDVRDQEDDIWIWSFARGTLTRLTIDPQLDLGVDWTPDGRRIAYSSSADKGNIYWQAADGTGAPERLTVRDRPQRPTAFAPDGRTLVFAEPANPPRDLALVHLTGERKTELLLGETPFDELNGEISPDHRWLAYESDESGRKEVYVRPFPNVNGGRWQVSTNGGTRPYWRPDGSELFYWSATGDNTGQIMVVSVTSGGSFTAGRPRLAVERSYLAPISGRSYDVSPDGRRFLVIKDAPAPTSAPSELVVVLNWFAELKRLVPTQ
jgi:serine/threonine-protein kinase